MGLLDCRESVLYICYNCAREPGMPLYRQMQLLFQGQCNAALLWLQLIRELNRPSITIVPITVAVL